MSNETDFNVCVVLPASGCGERMGLPSPKQYCRIIDKPLILYSIHIFQRVPWIQHILVTTGKEHVNYIQSLCLEYGFDKVVVTPGGTARHRSIYCGVKKIQEVCEKPDVVIIQDAVRLFAQEDLLRKVAIAAEQHGASGVIRPLVSTVIATDADGFLEESLDRNKYRASEMPQGFQYEVIKNAYEKNLYNRVQRVNNAKKAWKCPAKKISPTSQQFSKRRKQATDYDFDYGTECLHLAQKYSKVPVYLIEGSADLWKVTYQKDLHAAEAMLKDNLMRLCVVEQLDNLTRNIQKTFNCSSKIKIENMPMNFEQDSLHHFNTIVLNHQKECLTEEEIKAKVQLTLNTVSGKRKCANSALFNTVIVHVMKSSTDEQFYGLHRACTDIFQEWKRHSSNNDIVMKALILKCTTPEQTIGSFVKELVWNRDPLFNGQVVSI